MRNMEVLASPASSEFSQRMRLVIYGAVQGVGFRPFVYRIAQEHGLFGWVCNNHQGVVIEVEGRKERLDQFMDGLYQHRLPQAMIQSMETSCLDAVGYASFEIRPSEIGAQTDLFVMPDMAMCRDCREDISDPKNRRYRYPFTNCTNCGPRYSIIHDVPYDRARTSMCDFVMCPECHEEYTKPRDRRFHAQPNACAVCGPRLALWDSSGCVLHVQDEALVQTASMIRAGKIAAIKGLGGFHLVADGRNESVVRLLRERKRREEKPFAMMFPSLAILRKVCEVSEMEERLLLSSAAPIVLLHRKTGQDTPGTDFKIAPSVAPNNPDLGVMLPYTPLHYLLMKELGFPVVATSANISDEPICIDEVEALDRLNGIADIFLVHNRPILRHVDDSIVRIMMNREFVMRRARGYAPLPIHLIQASVPTLALGSELKNTICCVNQHWAYMSAHIGDLNNTLAYQAFKKTFNALKRLFKIAPVQYVRDLNPDCSSNKILESDPSIPVISVQHHYAHILSCMAENAIEDPAFGIAWDGTGFGPDRTVWGGEFLSIGATSFLRVAHLRRFRLPGSDKAVLEPRRVALSLLYDILGDQVFELHHLKFMNAFQNQELGLIRSMLQKGIQAPLTSSMGRFFDGVSA
ncbi:MAG: carbamoyltransferase HypF, partial [Chlamydiota bacterium]|nr:carbamoyltransferase HypF [Chlamydiota bacterium]